jgi:hypothetical protein
MTKKQFNENVDDIIARMVLKAMKAYAASQPIEDDNEEEPVKPKESVFDDDDLYGYEDDLRDRYNQMKGG